MPNPTAAPAAAHHLLVPFAAAEGTACRALLPTLQLPNLQALLGLLTPSHTDGGDEHSLSTPHERALARALGLATTDGLIPWAAIQSDTPTAPQAWFSPCHFQIGTDQISLIPGEQMGLDEGTSRALVDALAPYCAEDGITLRFDHATRWRASGEPLRGIACASLDRVGGRPVGGFMPESPDNPGGSLLLKRLQSEAQMLFYSHPVHDARQGQGLLPVNGFWISGAGALNAALPPSRPPTVPDTLRQAALRTDWPAWQQAWTQLDATHIKTLL
ncbi:MAG: phosphoglycerate mutase, partial [Hydrogenophaga sp.]|nr:phosphoglycerate mutase [Hydrogenophaga sp.]